MPRFVRGDEVREDSSESRVIRPIDVCVGAGDDLRSTVRLVDVAGFAVIVPWDPSVSMERNEDQDRHTGDDLHKVGLDVEDLHPSVIPQALARGVPVLVPLWESCRIVSKAAPRASNSRRKATYSCRTTD